MTQRIAPWVPFLVALGVIGLVMSVLIVVSVVSGTVAAGTRRIGVLKSVGFTPAQVVAVYILQVAVSGVIGAVLGAVIANLLAARLFGRTSSVLAVAPSRCRAVLPIMGNAAETAVPAAIYNVYSPAELVLLALAGLVIAVLSALAPAAWAARARTALALRTELPPAGLFRLTRTAASCCYQRCPRCTVLVWRPLSWRICAGPGTCSTASTRGRWTSRRWPAPR